MKRKLLYFFVNFCLLMVLAPVYVQMPKFQDGYRAYLYCKNGMCNKGYVLDVDNNSSQNVKVNFLDSKDKLFYTRLINELKYKNQDISYIILSDRDCIENEVKTRDIKNGIKFKKLPRPAPVEEKKVEAFIPSNNTEKCEEKVVEDEIPLCDLDVIESSEHFSKFEYLFRYTLYKLA